MMRRENELGIIVNANALNGLSLLICVPCRRAWDLTSTLLGVQRRQVDAFIMCACNYLFAFKFFSESHGVKVL